MYYKLYVEAQSTVQMFIMYLRPVNGKNGNSWLETEFLKAGCGMV